MRALLVFSLLLTVTYARKGFGPGEQDWGYVTVRPSAHMFWWLYETTANVSNKTERPLVVWLQGGPGQSGTGIGNFLELGPLDEKLNPRNKTWVKHVNVLFIDNPVGAGYSYIDSMNALSSTNKQVADDLVVLMGKFLERHPEFRTVPLYITSEGYGGKMAVEFVYELHKSIKAGNLRANLTGINLIDPWIHPIQYSLNWAPYLYNVGAIDQEGFDEVTKYAQLAKTYLDAGEYKLATRAMRFTLYIIVNIAHNIDLYNILTNIPSSNKAPMVKPQIGRNIPENKVDWIMNGPVKQALNLNVTWGASMFYVFNSLEEDHMKPVNHIVEQLLNETDIKVQVVTGQLDLLVPTPGTVQWVNDLKWSGSSKWKETYRSALSVNGINEGYKKILDKFSMFWVNRSGQMVPADNAAAMEAILNHLIGK